MINLNNKKGFTLIELLAIIVVLALIAVIVFPGVTRLITGAKSDTNKVQFSSIEKALKVYITSHGATIKSGDQVCISDLKADGLLENKKIINQTTNEEYTGCFTLTWDSSKKQFSYVYTGGGAGEKEYPDYHIDPYEGSGGGSGSGGSGSGGSDSGTLAAFIPGPELNEIILEYEDAKVFKKATTAPSNTSNATLVSTVNSPNEIYIWYNETDNTIYWWSDATKVYLNPNSSYIFANTSIESIDLSTLKTDYVTDISYLTYGDYSLNYFNISGLNLSKVENYGFFYKEYPYYYELSDEELEEYYNSGNYENLGITIDVYDDWQSYSYDWYGIDADSTIVANNIILPSSGGAMTGTLIHYSIDDSLLGVESWNTDNVVVASSLLADLEGVDSLDLSGWNTSNVIVADGMFFNNGSSSINVNGWNTEKIRIMDLMFSIVSLESLNLSSWNTDNVRSFDHMFCASNIQDDLDLSKFNTENVTSMSGLFYAANISGSINLSGWDTSKVTSMTEMFKNTSIIGILDLSDFDTKNVSYMGEMFEDSNVQTIYVSDKFVTTNLDLDSYYYGDYNMFNGAYNLVGGNGTAYTDEYVSDSSYARIDKPGQKGYFTEKTN